MAEEFFYRIILNGVKFPVKNVRKHFGPILNDSKTQLWQVIAYCKRSWNSKWWRITNAFNDFSVILMDI